MKMLKIYINYTGLHHKNKHGLHLLIGKYFIEVSQEHDADIIYCPAIYVDTHRYPDKLYIFGPHFSTFPNDNLRAISNKYGNAVYVQPSTWVTNQYLQTFAVSNVPVRTLPFPVDIESFIPINVTKNLCFIYYKHRAPEALQYVKQELKTAGYSPIVFSYDAGYTETTYLNTLQRSLFGIIIDAHESQGFAIQEALSTNVPLLVWNVSRMYQEANCPQQYYTVETTVTSVPYWNSCCGEVFYTQEQFKDTFTIFIDNLHIYQPRQFIVDTLSRDVIYTKYWSQMLQEHFTSQ